MINTRDLLNIHRVCRWSEQQESCKHQALKITEWLKVTKAWWLQAGM